MIHKWRYTGIYNKPTIKEGRKKDDGLYCVRMCIYNIYIYIFIYIYIYLVELINEYVIINDKIMGIEVTTMINKWGL